MFVHLKNIKKDENWSKADRTPWAAEAPFFSCPASPGGWRRRTEWIHLWRGLGCIGGNARSWDWGQIARFWGHRRCVTGFGGWCGGSASGGRKASARRRLSTRETRKGMVRAGRDSAPRAQRRRQRTRSHGNHPVSPQCDFGGFHPHRYKCGRRCLTRKLFPLFFSLSLFFNSYATSAKRWADYQIKCT
jgi:hypothetical protein